MEAIDDQVRQISKDRSRVFGDLSDEEAVDLARVDAPARADMTRRVEVSGPQPPGQTVVPPRVHVLTLVDNLFTTGGAERVALEIATRLAPSRYRSTLCASRFVTTRAPSEGELPAIERIRDAGIDFLALGRRRRGDIGPWRHLAAYIRHHRVDVLHAHMFGSNLWGTVIGRMARVPIIIAHEHTWSFEGEPLRRVLDREIIGRWSNAFVAVSRADRRKMIEIERIPAERIRYIPNGIAPRPPTRGRDLRAELGVGSGPLLGAVGTLRAQKAYDVLIRAAAELRRDHPGLHVLIAGDGPEKQQLEALARELGLVDVVLMLGRRMDVPDLLAELDVAVCSSDFEGSPLAVMEYMDAGLPIVATRVGGVPDLIEDGVQGVLVEPRDPAALASAIHEMLTDRARASALGARARERRRREFDLDVMVRNVEALYQELLAARP
jgi:glycosyltransferase involved in cell wall biosynthesis